MSSWKVPVGSLVQAMWSLPDVLGISASFFWGLNPTTYPSSTQPIRTKVFGQHLGCRLLSFATLSAELPQRIPGRKHAPSLSVRVPGLEKTLAKTFLGLALR